MSLSGEPVELLREGGLANPRRAVTLIRDTIAVLELDLRGLTVLTEAASCAYVVTPIIAAMAGAARVIALTRDSRFATAAEVIRQTRALEQLAGLNERVEIHTARNLELFASADIVTNLGFVRPIDKDAIFQMRPGTVVPLMCEAWEFRQGDVDLEACASRGVHVLATNEEFPGVDVFAYSGWLCVKLLLDAGIELHKTRVLVVSSDKFGPVITRLLRRSGVEARLAPRLLPSLAQASDAIVIADYTRQDEIIGETGDLRPSDIHQVAPGVVVVQFAGRVDVAALRCCGVMVYPGQNLPSHRMARTLAALGPRPVIELHAAGLKVGEIGIAMRKDRRNNKRFDGLAQPLARASGTDSGDHGRPPRRNCG
jgi:hypothetical protein